MKTIYQKCLATFPFLLISITTICGQIENQKYLNDAIYLKGSKYVKNGVEYPIGSWGRNLKKEMEISSNAMAEYKIFEQKRKNAFILSTVGIAAGITAFSIHNRDFGFGLFIGSLGLTIASIPISNKANNSFQKAIWIRNGEILK